jgi:hypothetical protein
MLAAVRIVFDSIGASGRGGILSPLPPERRPRQLARAWGVVNARREGRIGIGNQVF